MENRTQGSRDELVEACLGGDRKAQYRFYRKYARGLYNVSMRIVNHSAVAEDILQESFIDAFDRLHEFRSEGGVGAWLKRIVVNNSINWLRRGRTSWEDIGDNEPVVPDGELQDREAVELQVRAVRQGIARLPEGYRVVLSLYLLEGYDHGEIGQILGINEASSRSQYLRAKKKLLEIIKKSEYERQT